MWLGLQTVPSLGRCPLFRVTFIERFHCILHTWRSLLTCACSLLPPGPASNRRWEERIHSTFGESNSEASTSAFPKQTASKYSKSGAHWCSHIVHTRPHPHPRTHTMTAIYIFLLTERHQWLPRKCASWRISPYSEGRGVFLGRRRWEHDWTEQGRSEDYGGDKERLVAAMYSMYVRMQLATVQSTPFTESRVSLIVMLWVLSLVGDHQHRWTYVCTHIQVQMVCVCVDLTHTHTHTHTHIHAHLYNTHTYMNLCIFSRTCTPNRYSIRNMSSFFLSQQLTWTPWQLPWSAFVTRHVVSQHNRQQLDQ